MTRPIVVNGRRRLMQRRLDALEAYESEAYIYADDIVRELCRHFVPESEHARLELPPISTESPVPDPDPAKQHPTFVAGERTARAPSRLARESAATRTDPPSESDPQATNGGRREDPKS